MHVQPPYPIAIAKANTQLSQENTNRHYYSFDSTGALHYNHVPLSIHHDISETALPINETQF